jgi:hypothetical protein
MDDRIYDMKAETVIRVWLKNSQLPPQGVWRQNGIVVLKEVHAGPDHLDLRVRGDGHDVERLVSSRQDLFFGCDLTPQNPQT